MVRTRRSRGLEGLRAMQLSLCFGVFWAVAWRFTTFSGVEELRHGCWETWIILKVDALRFYIPNMVH